MAIFDIKTHDNMQQVLITLSNNSVYFEPSKMLYSIGSINIDSPFLNIKNNIYSCFLGKHHYKPKLKGTGTIYLKPSFKSFYLINLDNNALILEKNTFVAATINLKIKPLITCSAIKHLSGTPFSQTLVEGCGKLVIAAPGPMKIITINSEKFIANNNILARSANINLNKINIIHKSMKIYQGTGEIYFSPYPNKDHFISNL